MRCWLKIFFFVVVLICYVYHLCSSYYDQGQDETGRKAGGGSKKYVSSNGAVDSVLASAFNDFVKPSRNQKLPKCLLIGVRKGGTRALLDMLNLHSKIKISNSEVHFFDNDTNYARGLEWYRAQMPGLTLGSEATEIAIEKSPSYFVTPSVPNRVHAMDSRIKLLLIVRDPVTRLVSDYTQILYNHKEKGLAYKSFESLAFLPDGNVNRNYDALVRSLYVNYMLRWLDHFPLSQIHVVNGDRLIKKPWHELNRVERFLGLKSEIKRQHFFFNTTKGFHCIHKTTDDEGEGHCLNKSKGRPHPNVSIENMHKLRSFFRPFNYRFYDLVGQDFGWPGE